MLSCFLGALITKSLIIVFRSELNSELIIWFLPCCYVGFSPISILQSVDICNLFFPSSIVFFLFLFVCSTSDFNENCLFKTVSFANDFTYEIMVRISQMILYVIAFNTFFIEWYILSRTLAKSVGPQNMCDAKSCSNLVNAIAIQEMDGVLELTPSSNSDLHNETSVSESSHGKEIVNCCQQSEIKPLILFEDVDVTFIEDRGFVTAIQHISKTAKGPIILTSNSKRVTGLNIYTLT